MKIIATNKQAYHEYFVIENIEAGVQLIGCEVKSIRLGEVNLKDSFATISHGEIFLKNVYIKPYEKGSFSNLESRRDRKLLLNKNEILRLLGKVQEKGFSLVPLKLYFEKALVKVELALVKGKQLYDKRDAIADKDIQRDQDRQIREYTKR